MKTVSGKIVSTKPVSLSKAANIMSNFVSSDNGASQAVGAYLRRASAAFNELAYFKKHHRMKKSSSKEEASTISDASHISFREHEVRVLENGAVNKKFDQDPVEIDENRAREVDGKLRKKDKKRKKNEDGLRGGERDNVEDNETTSKNNEEKKKKKKKKKSKNAEVDGGEISNPVTPEKKKRRRTEVDD